MILIRYTKGAPLILRNAKRLESRIKQLGQPIIERIIGGFQLNWIYSARVGPNKYEPQLATYDLKIQDEREIVELEILEE